VIRRFVCLIALCTVSLAVDDPSQPSLTIYNQNFAVVRQDLPLELKSGVNSIRVTDITMHLEPDSVILRDPSGKRSIQVLEQNYHADPVSESLLLSLCEGKTIDFLVQRENKQEIVPGKIIRSGYVPHSRMAMRQYGAEYYQAQMSQVGSEQSIVEVEGKVRFGLPGTPLFPTLGNDAVLKPTLQWLLSTQSPGPLRAEFSYVTGGLTWEADYNIIAPEKGNAVDIVGWVTMDNQSGKRFQNARIKLMAGDINKIQPEQMYDRVQVFGSAGGIGGGVMTPAVTERTFDEYHLYTLARSATLDDRETKQVEFIRAGNVSTAQIYVYDGLKLDPNRYNGWNWENIRNDFSYGTESNPKIWVMREFNNSEANHLGMPLPKGRVRFYRRNDDGQIEFTGENVIDHTPRDEKVRVYTGNAFDLTGERRRTDYRLDANRQTIDESFEIKVRNHKKEPVDVRVLEHLYRWITWDISAKSEPYRKTDSKTIEFLVTIPPDGEKAITYTAHYTW
jgi:hypothetical protein